MDRNLKRSKIMKNRRVALRKESVDRNITRGQLPTPEPVALRKESVDRNIFDVSLNYKEVLSLSARRAWIEIVEFHLC